jgi:polyisoprenoid-binding protein YceI
MKSILTLLFVSIIGFAQAQTKSIEVSSSTIGWKGSKITSAHYGNINFKSGLIIFKNNKVVGGSFEVDMTSLVCTDLEPGKGKEKLEKHLKNADFFDVEKFPTAKLVFKKIKGLDKNLYEITADLTIKGITQPVTFSLNVADTKGGGQLVFDRTKFDIKYGSGSFFDNLGDKAISNDIELNVMFALK